VSGGNGGSISYVTDDDSIVTVDANGLMNAVGAGTANIAVRESAHDIYPEQTIVISVTVNKLTGNVLATTLTRLWGHPNIAYNLLPYIKGGNGGALVVTSTMPEFTTITGTTVTFGGNTNIVYPILTFTEPETQYYKGQSITIPVTLYTN
ncbi:Ig-like domain-containing protein, partial [Aeromonas veronii]|uniref:Ig-like domain-containing protein n=1 Tax=Aeromonas veronii TaxID=654 RepID=UPI00405566F0